MTDREIIARAIHEMRGLSQSGYDPQALNMADILIAALLSAGKVIVPVEPTPEMIEAGAFGTHPADTWECMMVASSGYFDRQGGAVRSNVPKET